MSLLKEHRLLPVVMNVTPINRRAAQKASAAQNANADTKGTREGSNPYADFVEENVQVNYLPPGSDPSNGGRVLTAEEGVYNDEAMRLADASLYVKAPGYNPAKPPAAAAAVPSAPTAPEETGKIDQNAIKRLMNAGLTYEQSVERIKGNREEIQQITSNTGLGGSFDSQGKFVPPPPIQSSPEREAARNLQQQISELSKPLGDQSPIYDRKGNIVTPAAVVKAQMEAERAKQLAELQKALTAMQQRSQSGQGGVPTSSSSSSPAQAGAEQVPGAPSGTAALPSADPATGLQSVGVTGADADLENARANALKGLNDRLNLIDAPSDTAIDRKVQERMQLDSFKEQLKASDAQEQVQKEEALEKQRKELAINDRATSLARIEKAKEELDQINLNTESEIKNRRIINKLSGGHDFGGLQWVQKQTQVGLDALNYIRDKAANMEMVSADKAIAIINDYTLDLRKAEATKKQSYADDYEKYITNLDDIRKELKDDETEKRKMRDKAHEDYSKLLTDADFKHGDYLQQLTLKARDRMWQVEDRDIKTKETKFTQGISFMNMLTDKNIGSTPAELRIAEEMMGLPSGSLSIIREVKGTGGGSGLSNIQGYTNEQVQEAALAYFKVNNKLPGKSELPTMVATYYHNRQQIQAGMSTAHGEQPDVFSNPFEEMKAASELGTRFAEYQRVKSDGSYKADFFTFMKDTRSPLFALPDLQNLDLGGTSSAPASTTSALPGITTFGK